jgi:hypothetical protein
MNKEDQHIKPYLQILLGVALIILHKIIDAPIKILSKWKESNSYSPSDELFFHFLSWATLLGSIFLIILGSLQLIKRWKNS